MFLKNILFVLTILLCFQAESQLHLAKDPESCSFGLKDAAGKWIVEPYYSAMSNSVNNKFLVMDLDLTGILNSDGSVLIPAIYDEVRSGKAYFEVRKGGFWSIFDLSGKQLFDFKYTSVTSDEYGRYYLYISTGLKKSSTVANVSGQILIPETAGTIMPFKERPITPFLSSSENPSLQRWGLIDISGKVVRQPQYLYIEACYNNFIVTSDKGTGYISFNNKVLLEPKYAVVLPEYTQSNCLAETYEYVFYEGKKAGLMNGKFEIIVKPIYDRIERISYHGSDSAAFQVQLNNKWGLLTPSGRQSIPPIYDTIYPRSVSKDDYARVTYKGFYFCVKNGRTELRNDRNQQIVPGNYDSFDLYSRNDGQFWMLMNGKELTVYRWGINDIFKAQMVEKVDSICVFMFGNYFIPFVLGNNGKGLKSLAGQIQTVGNHHFITLRTENYDYATYIFTKQGKHMPSKGLRHVQQIINTQLVLFRYKVGMQLWNTRTGKSLTDTIYGEFQPAYVSKNLIWARDYTYKTNTYGYWHPLDTNGRLRSTEAFGYHFFPGKKQAATASNGKTGIIDTNFNWIVTPDYKLAQVLTDDYFAVQTESGKWGISEKNKLEIDTSYTKFELLFSSCDGQHMYNKNASEAICVLSKGKEELLFRSSGSKTTNASEIRSERINSFFTYQNCSGGLYVSIDLVRRKDFLKTPFPEILYDTLYSPQTGQSGTSPVIYRNQSNFTIAEFGPRFCSLSSVQNDHNIELDYGFIRQQPYLNQQLFLNYISDGKSAKIFSLKDLFNSEEQKDRMIRTAMKRTLSEQECLSPTLPEINSYSLSKEGVVIQFDWYKKILLTISDLEKESTNWILDYLR